MFVLMFPFTWDHPRGCGENCSLGRWINQRAGITPADAGKTRTSTAHGSRAQDHPRGCGENCAGILIREGVIGSPPRMRGKLSVYNIKRNQIGSPPQVRGKRYRRIYNIKSGNGSPPQVRGKREVRTTPRVTLRITPAGAGKTFSPAVNYRNKKDHPRRCGENDIVTYSAVQALGSPPQVRGKLGQNANGVPLIRITPAGAGKTYFCHFTIH